MLLGVETVLWPRVAKRSGKWHTGVFQAADCFMARWHRDEALRSRLCQGAEDIRNGDRGGRGGGRGRRTHTAVVVDE